MTAARVNSWTKWLGLLLGVGFVAAGIVGWIAEVNDADGSDLAYWVIFLVGGGILVLAAVVVGGLPDWLAVVLGTAGALAGALALFWTVIVPLLALAFVVLLVLRSRNETVLPT
jgi:hypothetical protein